VNWGNDRSSERNEGATPLVMMSSRWGRSSDKTGPPLPSRKGNLVMWERGYYCKYGDVFSERTESRSRPFDPSRRRENTAPPQDERICKRIYEMLHLASQDQFRGRLTNLDNRDSKSPPGRQTILEAACTRPMQMPSQ
jgi:hypothetical protein